MFAYLFKEIGCVDFVLLPQDISFPAIAVARNQTKGGTNYLSKGSAKEGPGARKLLVLAYQCSICRRLFGTGKPWPGTSYLNPDAGVRDAHWVDGPGATYIRWRCSGGGGRGIW